MHWRELEVWKLSHQMVLDVYKMTSSFPDHEKFRLTGQMCRAASSVPTNIVEGNARYSRKEYIQFLITARASLEETRYHGLLARDLQYIESSHYDQFETKAERISRMLNSFLRSLKSKGKSDT
ncbi:MAG TPA: four helix bundle protein [Nitrospira sp.]|nr:four helix bundle protein [Nitrospira sp.]